MSQQQVVQFPITELFFYRILPVLPLPVLGLYLRYPPFAHFLQCAAVHFFLYLVLSPIVRRIWHCLKALDNFRYRHGVPLVYFLCGLFTFFIAVLYCWQNASLIDIASFFSWVFDLSSELRSTGKQMPVNRVRTARPQASSGKFGVGVRNVVHTGVAYNPRGLGSMIHFIHQKWIFGVNVVGTSREYYLHMFNFVWDCSLFWYALIPVAVCYWGAQVWSYVLQNFFGLFHDLGRGASEPNFRGWALARFREWLAHVDIFTPQRVHPMSDPYRGYLNTLPLRGGERPVIDGVTPQRQTTLRAPPNTMEILGRMMEEFVQDDEVDQITIRTSYLERGLMALRRTLTRSVPLDDNGGARNIADVRGSVDQFGGEIYHPHRDGTSHVVLHPEDARIVFEAGWGQRHPFTVQHQFWGKVWQFYWYKYMSSRLPVPEGLMILYSPRHQGDFEVIRQIIRAAVWNGTSGRVGRLTADSYPVPPAPEAPDNAPTVVTSAIEPL
ncbi:hypothetical protein F5Y18DRAFT_77901 [Xylariaceae sp. FL1019]|nr:hypothetical protein F5Y18DRAFT_77901 [Xylariaceae sp. FL1019]